MAGAYSPRHASSAPGGLREVLIYDPRSEPKLRRRTLPEVAAAQPVSFADGLLVPAKIGQVLVIDPDSGRRLIEPFQPIVDAGSEVAWTEPTTFGDAQAPSPTARPSFTACPSRRRRALIWKLRPRYPWPCR